MMETSAFGMVTILSLTSVSSRKLPVKLWSAGTLSSESTWDGKGSRLEKGTWKPANYVGTFEGKRGAKVKKLSKNGQSSNFKLTDINSSSSVVLNATQISNTYLLLRNDGEVVQYQVDNSITTAVYTSNTAPKFAPIQWSNATSTLCLTAASKNADVSFRLCDRQKGQQWMFNSDKQVLNQGTGGCLDGTSGKSARSSSCDSENTLQNWYWDKGYLRLGSKSGNCLKVKSLSTVVPVSEITKDCVKGLPLTRMVWNI
jgi:hypothetical protein